MKFNEIIKGMTRQDIEKAAEAIIQSDEKGNWSFRYCIIWKECYFSIRSLLYTAYEIKHNEPLPTGEKNVGKNGYKYLKEKHKYFNVIDIKGEGKKIEEEIAEMAKNSPKSFQDGGRMRDAIVKVRINQNTFRSMLLAKYQNKCCLCNVNTPDLLIASHIKPWSLSEPKERMDVENGFLMCPNHDKLFDKGWISFDESGKIMISKSLSEEVKKAMNVDDNMSIHLTDGNKEYLVCHRQEIFIDKE